MRTRYYAKANNGVYLCLNAANGVWYLSLNPAEAFLATSRKNLEEILVDQGATGMGIYEYNE